MKKVLIPFVIIILLVGIAIFIPSTFKSNKNKDKPAKSISWENMAKRKYSYYNDSLEKRYLAYRDKHRNLSDEDIITHVNIGLDNPYYTNTTLSTNLNTPYTLVNKYSYLKDDFVPNDLLELDEEYSKGGIYLVKEARDNFIKLATAAKNENLTIRAISAYRGYTYQERLYKSYALNDGEAKADTYSARPGFSDHQTGLSVDVDNNVLSFDDFGKTDEYKWMMEHASEYGFILRYPEGKEDITGYMYEAWHYRYVGVDVAKKIKDSKLTFDEYYVRYLTK